MAAPAPSLSVNAQTIKAARQAGYSDQDIINYIGQNQGYAPKVQQALQAGYQPADIVNYLGGANAPARAASSSSALPVDHDPVGTWLGNTAPAKLIKDIGAHIGLAPASDKLSAEQLGGAALGTGADIAGALTLNPELFGLDALGSAGAAGSAARIGAQGALGAAGSAAGALGQNQSANNVLNSAMSGGLTGLATAGLLEGAGSAATRIGNAFINKGTNIAENAPLNDLNLTKGQQTSFFNKTGQQLVPWLKQNGLVSSDPQVIQDALDTTQEQFNALANKKGATVSSDNLLNDLQNKFEDMNKGADPASKAQAQKFADSANAIANNLGISGTNGDIPVSKLNDLRIEQDGLASKSSFLDPNTADVHNNLRDILSQNVENATQQHGDLDATGKKMNQLITYKNLVGNKLAAGTQAASQATSPLKSLTPYLIKAGAGAIAGGLTGKSLTSAAIGGALGLTENALEPKITTPEFRSSINTGIGNTLTKTTSPGVRSLIELLTTAASHK